MTTVCGEKTWTHVRLCRTPPAFLSRLYMRVRFGWQLCGVSWEKVHDRDDEDEQWVGGYRVKLTYRRQGSHRDMPMTKAGLLRPVYQGDYRTEETSLRVPWGNASLWDLLRLGWFYLSSVRIFSRKVRGG